MVKFYPKEVLPIEKHLVLNHLLIVIESKWHKVCQQSTIEGLDSSPLSLLSKLRGVTIGSSIITYSSPHGLTTYQIPFSTWFKM